MRVPVHACVSVVSVHAVCVCCACVCIHDIFVRILVLVCVYAWCVFMQALHICLETEEKTYFY